MPGLILDPSSPADVQILSPGSLSSNTLPRLLLENNLNLDALRTNALLRKDEWELLDTRLVTTFNEALNGIADLRNRGLTLDLGGMQTIISQYEKQSDMDEAMVHMAAAIEDEQDRTQYSLVSVPVPVISKGFQFDIRHLSASRRLGQSLDTTNSETAARKVAEKLEDILFNGNVSVMGGSPIYGYRTHPHRNTNTGADWGTATNIYTNILEMITIMAADRVYTGPFVLYVNPAQYVQTLAISDTTRMKSELQVALDSIPQLEAITPTDKMPAGECCLVSMTRDTTELAIGEDVSNVEWESMGGMASHFKVMTVAVPRVKSDYSGRCGIVHTTGI
jgi:uncharacterized linocin/CFP29 family protein